MIRADELPEDVDEFFDKKQESSFLAKAKLIFLLQAFQRGIDLANHVGSKMVSAEDVWSAAVKQAIIDKNLSLSAKAIGTMEDDLRNVLLQAHKEGVGVRGLATKINELYGNSMGYRSLRIARTELTGTINDGSFSTYKEQGYAEKTWSTVLDGHERDSHHDADGQTVAMDEHFHLAGGDAMFPGDPDLPISETANCRCVVQPSGVPEERTLQLNQMFLRLHGSMEQRMVWSLKQQFANQRDRILARLGVEGTVI